MKEKVLFKSKEYGIGGHNKLELRRMDNGELRLWVRDGDTNALICMDREDLTKLGKTVTKHAKKAPLEVESFDFSKPIRKKKKVTTTSETNGVKGKDSSITTEIPQRKRKQRSDKGVKRGPRKKK